MTRTCQYARLKLLGLCGDKLIYDVCESLIQQQPPQVQPTDAETGAAAAETKEKGTKSSKSQKDKNLSTKVFTVASIVDELKVQPLMLVYSACFSQPTQLNLTI